MNLKHGQRDPETGKYWNGITNKLLKKPVRDSTKGQHINKNKGKAIGASKENSYNKTLDQLKLNTHFYGRVTVG